MLLFIFFLLSRFVSCCNQMRCFHAFIHHCFHVSRRHKHTNTHTHQVSDILEGTRNALVGIDILRKVCNHPDLLERASHATLPDYGNPERSGKLGVALRVLQHWQQQDCKYEIATLPACMDMLHGTMRCIDALTT